MLNVVDSNLEEETTWRVVNQPDVNDPMADGYALVQTDNGMRSYCVGQPYAGACGSLTRPAMDGFYHPSLQFEVLPDECIGSNAQVNEFDLRIQAGRWNYNMSGQLNLAKGGMWQLVDGDEAWVDTEFVPGLFSADFWTYVQLDYEFDIGAHTFSTRKVSIGNQVWEVPESYWNVPASEMDWEDRTATIQVQLGLNNRGGACSHKVRQLTIYWK